MNQPSKIAVLTSGGDAPGMNAALRAAVRTISWHKKLACGVYRGYDGLISNDIKYLDARSVNHILGRGGTMLKSARSEGFRTKEGRQTAFENLSAQGIDSLIVIGGDGSLTGAHLIHKEHGIPIVGIPATIDNDLKGTDESIGFDTALNTAVEAVDKIRDTAASHNRLFLVEVMGRNSGEIALATGIATGALAVMTPEENLGVDDLIQSLERGRLNKKTSNIVIVAEGYGKGGAKELGDIIQQQTDLYETKVTVLGHIQRGGQPSVRDRLLASELGHAAVEALMNGKKDVMVGLKQSNIEHIPILEAVQSKKHLNPNYLQLVKELSI
ncbi:MAG TPA: 6-phosphofructokinase [Bacteroidetes bacterium]|nr:6-phosphofructokinase [Bacteroidota bacterium]